MHPIEQLRCSLKIATNKFENGEARDPVVKAKYDRIYSFCAVVTCYKRYRDAALGHVQHLFVRFRGLTAYKLKQFEKF